MKTIKINNIEVSEEELKRVIKENPQLVEEKTSKNWINSGGDYYNIDGAGNIFKYIDVCSYLDDYRYKTLNYFKTRKEAEAKNEHDLALGKVTRAIWEANGDWEVDWSDDEQCKYYIFFDNYHDNYFSIGYIYSNNSIPKLPYIKSKEIAEKIIKDYEKELKVIFGVK